MQINPENYQSRPPLPEGAPLAHTDSSVNLTTFALLFCLIELLDFRLMMVVFVRRSIVQSDGVRCLGQGGGRTVC